MIFYLLTTKPSAATTSAVNNQIKTIKRILKAARNADEAIEMLLGKKKGGQETETTDGAVAKPANKKRKQPEPDSEA